ncbi:MAG: YfiR family protein [Verrucomicrobia bacterium]|nr:YfiR family protein [Verrucomicrobiota bacterium]
MNPSHKRLTWRMRCLITAAAFLVSQATGQFVFRDEFEARAAYLQEFARLVEWPTNRLGDTNLPLVVGILGSDPWKGRLAEYLNKPVHGHRVEVKPYRSVQDAKDEAHILFISSSEERKLQQVFGHLRQKRILTIGETKRFAILQGMICFHTPGTPDYSVNTNAAAQAKLPLDPLIVQAAKPAPWDK